MYAKIEVSKDRYSTSLAERELMKKNYMAFPINHYYNPMSNLKLLLERNKDSTPLSKFDIDKIMSFWDKLNVI